MVRVNSSEEQLPEGWRWVRLGDVCEFSYGSSLPSRLRQQGDVPVYGSNGIVGYHTRSLTSGPTIIIGRKGSIGEIRLSPQSCWPIDTTYYIEHVRIEADLIWLAYWLKALDLPALNKAAAVPGLNRSDAYACEIPLPPLPEQQRIAAILKEQMAAVERARTAAEAQLEASKALPAAYLREVFDSPEAQEWSRQPLGDVAELLPAKSIATSGDTEVQAITTACLSESGFISSGVKVARMWEEDAAQCIVSPGEILIARSNTPELVGRVAMFAGEPKNAVASDLTIRIRSTDVAISEFLTACLSYRYVCGYWKERAGGGQGVR